jgi:glycosyltransferase involved in cell wall biosynthesis
MNRKLNNLTLLIPAKNESESLPLVLKELKKYNVKKIIVLQKDDLETIGAIKDKKTKIIFQKKNGYGSAIKEGIINIKTKYLCIFNADGSFNPRELNKMHNILNKSDFVFGSRYTNKAGSKDDTFLTFIGNKIFSLIGKLFFKIQLDDILYTFIMGKTKKFKSLKLKNYDFRICIEIPLKITLKKFRYTLSSSMERKRLHGEKKVNEFKDGFLISCYMLKKFLIK